LNIHQLVKLNGRVVRRSSTQKLQRTWSAPTFLTDLNTLSPSLQNLLDILTHSEFFDPWMEPEPINYPTTAHPAGDRPSDSHDFVKHVRHSGIIPTHRVNVQQKVMEGDFTASDFVGGDREVDRTPVIAFEDYDAVRMIACRSEALKCDVIAAIGLRHHRPNAAMVFGQPGYFAHDILCTDTNGTYSLLRAQR
jgi:hypothetical protein